VYLFGAVLGFLILPGFNSQQFAAKKTKEILGKNPAAYDGDGLFGFPKYHRFGTSVICRMEFQASNNRK
jgi:hypothetical protein